MSLKGNKGEWSEIYVFLKLLSTGRVHAADSDLEKNPNVFYDILKVLRHEKIGKLSFKIDKSKQVIEIFNDGSGVLISSLEMSVFESEASKLLESIKETKANAAFSISDTEDFLSKVFIGALKAKSSDKSDLEIQIHDFNTGFEPVLGFSVKSRLGNPSTLLNASQSTNFTYKIIGEMTEDLANQINNEVNKEKRIKVIFQRLEESGCKCFFYKVDQDIFESNLMLIDSNLPFIYAQLILEYYKNSISNVKEALKAVEKKNPLDYNLSHGHPFYEYKFKKLLAESALGMLPKTVWNGVVDATGGYFVVREDGEVLCYHLYNRNEFENYLLNNTKFDTPSKSRNKFGEIFKVNDEYFLKLNVQVRFIK